MKLTVPTKWSDITISKFNRLVEIEQVTDIDPLEKRARRIGIACDVDYTTIMDVPLAGIERIEQKLLFLNKLPDQKFVNEFYLDGTHYTVNPDLKSFSPAQFIDFKEYVKDGNIMENLHRIATCFCIERGKAYKDIDNDSVSKLFNEQLTIDIVYPISAFFLNFWKASQTVIADYLTEMEIQMMREVTEEMEALSMNGSAKGGDGTAH